MKKLLKNILTGAFVLLFVFLLKMGRVNAASCRIGVSAPSTVSPNSTFKVTVTVSSSASLGSWEYTLGYDSSKVRLNSGQLHVVDYGNGSKQSASYTYSFKALSSGITSFKITNASVLDYESTNECLSSAGTASINIKTQEEVEASYSRNKNLSSLSVEGAELSPAFNKDTLEYEAKLPADTTKAKILATPADSKSSVTGAGEVDVIDGLNKIEITVTAEHGEKKTYVINLTVEELDPIVVTVGGKKYTIVRKAGMIENIPVGFVETKIKIKGQEVVAYKNEAAKITLLALKDNKGDVSLFIYENDKYTPFKDVKSKELNLLIIQTNKKAPLGFAKTSFKYNGQKIYGYELVGSKQAYYLVYAKDLETGKDNFYLLDKKNNSFQVLYTYPFEVMKYMAFAICIIVLLIILKLILKIIIKVSSNKEKQIKKYQSKIDNLRKKLDNEEFEEYEKQKDDSYDITDVDERPTIKKVEDDEYVIPKKSRKEKLNELKKAKERLDKEKPKYRRMSLEDDD